MGQILCWHIWCNCTDSTGTSPSFVTENTRHFLLLLSFCKNKDKIEIEALTAFSFTGPGFERLFINIKLWSISPWSIMQMCNCTAAALQCQGKYELSTSKKPSTCRPHKVHRAIQESPAPPGEGVFMLTVEYSEKMEIHMHTGCKFFGPAQICALHQCWWGLCSGNATWGCREFLLREWISSLLCKQLLLPLSPQFRIKGQLRAPLQWLKLK